MTILIPDPSEYELKEMLWSGAEDTLQEIIDAGMYSNLENYIEEMYEGQIGITELNDILRFESEQIKKDIGMFDLEDEVDAKVLKELKSDVKGVLKMEDLSDETYSLFNDLSDKLDELEDCDDESDFKDLKDEINDIKDEIYDVVIDGEEGGEPFRNDIEKNIIDVIDNDLFYN
jgi:hypothetical protein